MQPTKSKNIMKLEDVIKVSLETRYNLQMSKEALLSVLTNKMI